MKVRVEVVCLNADGDEQRRQVLTIERREMAGGTLGMELAGGKRGCGGRERFFSGQKRTGGGGEQRSNSIGARARNRSGNDSLYQMGRLRWVSTAVTFARRISRDASK